MGSKTIKDITATQTILNRTDWIEIQEDAGTSKKAQALTLRENIIGEIIMYAVATAPANYLICNGAAISRTTYASLFAAIGTIYGIGNNSTTFNIPDYRAVSPKGVGDQTINTRVKTGPSSIGSKIEDTFENHYHSIGTYGAGPYNGFGAPNSVGASTNLSFAIDPYWSAYDPKTDGTNFLRIGPQTQDCTIGTNFCIRYQ